jgi:signal transduction histidine kinase
MFKSIRGQLALSYAGMTLLVIVALGGISLVTVRNYYAGRELDYLRGNAMVISSVVASMMAEDIPVEGRQAQLENLAFLSQTRLRIYNSEENLLMDSGSWQTADVVVGVAPLPSFGMTVSNEASDGPQTFQRLIVIGNQVQASAGPQMLNTDGNITAQPSGPDQILSTEGSVYVEHSVPADGNVQAQPQSAGADENILTRSPENVTFFSTLPVAGSMYGFNYNVEISNAQRSSQTFSVPITDPTSGVNLGFLELSQGPAYGLDIVKSVARSLAIAGAAAVLLAVAAGYWISRRISAPVVQLTAATTRMREGDLAVRAKGAAGLNELGSLAHSFNQMAERMEGTITALRHFVSDAAHELQTPLTALRTNLELALSENSTALRSTYLERSQELGERLQRLVSGLLDLSRLESANGRGEFQRLSLLEVARQVSEVYASRAEQSGQSFILDLPETLPSVPGSPLQLQQAIGNLLDNAVKFTPPGGEIRLGADSTDGEVRLWVQDTGIGIPSEDLELLFSRFHRSRNASAYPGSGLGLAIVKAIVCAHGGSVQAENLVGGGARFEITLPTGPAE